MSPDAKLHYNVHRWYSPETGSYLRVDPDPMVDPRFQMRYAYANRNPVRYSDPLGLRLKIPDDIDPQIRDAFDCALKYGPPEFRNAIIWIGMLKERWTFTALSRIRSDYDLREKGFLKIFKGECETRWDQSDPGTASQVDRVYNQFCIDDRAPSCEKLVGVIIREPLELYFHEVEGLEADTITNRIGPVSRRADPLVEEGVEKACKKCPCKDL